MFRFNFRRMLCVLFPLVACAFALAPRDTAAGRADGDTARIKKRWLFIWRDMSDAKEVDRMIARFPRAKADGYNGVAFSYNIPPSKAPELREAAKRNGLDLVAIVMGGAHDPNYMEGVLSKDTPYIARGGRVVHEPHEIAIKNGDFEAANGNHFNGCGFQDDEGVTTFADHDVVHGGKASLRMESIRKNDARHCRISQQITLTPNREYRISFWLKTENLSPADAEVKILSPDTSRQVSFQTFRVKPTQDWTHYDLVFNSLEYSNANLYLGTWNGRDGKMWWDDFKIEEIGLVNALRRPGCPITVRGENGTIYEESRDYERIVDPLLHPWQAYHEQPTVRLTAGTRIHEGERLGISYYHSIIIYEDRVTECLSEPKVFADWEQEVRTANDLYHPAAFLMSHDELRVINRCALCESFHMTPGELLARNVHMAAGIIRKVRPDAEIWVWNDMFDPMHNAVDNFYAVNGTLKGSWKGLDKGIGIVNWHGGLMGKNCKFFADMGLKQILSGYYDGDENGDSIAKWEDATKGIPGIEGAMYTTWEDKYDSMDQWAKRAWGGASR